MIGLKVSAVCMCLHLRIVWELCQLVLYREEISCLIGDEFVEVDEAIEEDADLSVVLP